MGISFGVMLLLVVVLIGANLALLKYGSKPMQPRKSATKTDKDSK